MTKETKKIIERVARNMAGPQLWKARAECKKDAENCPSKKEEYKAEEKIFDTEIKRRHDA